MNLESTMLYERFENDSMIYKGRSLVNLSENQFLSVIEISEPFKSGGWWDDYVGVEHLAVINYRVCVYRNIKKIQEAFICVKKGSKFIIGRGIPSDCFYLK